MRAYRSNAGVARSRRRRRPPLLMLGGLMVLVVAWWLGGGVLAAPLAQLRAALYYQATEASLESVRVVGISRAGETRWGAVVVYRYSVAGGERVSTRHAWLAPAFARREQARELADELRGRTEVVAWVDPRDDRRVVLDASLPPWRAWLAPAPWLGLMLLGGLLVVRGAGRR